MRAHCALLLWLLPALTVAPGMAFEKRGNAADVLACPGDCDDSGAVTVDEVVRLVRIALGELPTESCPMGDWNRDGEIRIDEILRAVGLLLAACPLSFRHDFRLGAEGWEAGFAEYPVADAPIFELEAGLQKLPPEIAGGGTAFRLASSNRSDDIFQYLFRRLGPEEGIEPDHEYELRFLVRFASNAPSGCIGIGGAPGEGVTLKLGGSRTEPQITIDAEGWAQVSLDKGNQVMGGTDMSAAGNLANGLPCEDVPLEDPPYVSLRREHLHPYPIRSSKAGFLWLGMGTDSGFEGRTAVYFQSLSVLLSPVEGGALAAPAAGSYDVGFASIRSPISKPCGKEGR